MTRRNKYALALKSTETIKQWIKDKRNDLVWSLSQLKYELREREINERMESFRYKGHWTGE